jgi:anti-sigma factor RsiW
LSCPDQETWTAYLRGGADDARATTLREHLDGCAACRAVVAKASARDAPISVPLGFGGGPTISFKEVDEAPSSAAVTVRPTGEEPPTSSPISSGVVTLRPTGDEAPKAPAPAVTLRPSGDED